MGISQRVHVFFGWIIDVDEKINEWAESRDYNLPNGTMFLGMDCDQIVYGYEVFKTTDTRWDALSGSSTFDEVSALCGLQYIQSNNDLSFFNPYMEDQIPTFHAFVNYS